VNHAGSSPISGAIGLASCSATQAALLPSMPSRIRYACSDIAKGIYEFLGHGDLPESVPPNAPPRIWAVNKRYGMPKRKKPREFNDLRGFRVVTGVFMGRCET